MPINLRLYDTSAGAVQQCSSASRKAEVRGSHDPPSCGGSGLQGGVPVALPGVEGGVLTGEEAAESVALVPGYCKSMSMVRLSRCLSTVGAVNTCRGGGSREWDEAGALPGACHAAACI